MEIRIRCSACLGELEATIVDNDVFVEPCEECLNEAFEEGKKEGRE